VANILEGKGLNLQEVSAMEPEKADGFSSNGPHSNINGRCNKF